jgi:hypothetical protein
MSNISLNDLAALSLVLNNITVKELIHNAMNGFTNEDNIKSKDNANICSQAINTFLS